MCYSDFPAQLFEIAGDSDAIRATGKKWKQFGDDCQSAQYAIKALDTSQFIGREAELYREGFTEAIPRELGATADAYLKVGGAIISLANRLGHLEDDEMTPLRLRAVNLWDAYRQSQHDLASAKATDSLLGQIYGSEQAAPAAQAEVDSLSSQWDAVVAAAADIKSRAAQVARECASAIRQLAGTRFQENPSGAEGAALNTRSYIVDHAAALDAISKALKLVSTAATVIGFIPGVGFVAFPIAAGAGAAALVIDSGVDLSKGKANIPLMVIDGVLIAVPGGKLAGPAVKRAVVKAYRKVSEAFSATHTASGPLTEQGIGSVLEGVLAGATPGKASKSLQFSKPGGYDAARADFDSLANGGTVTDRGGGLLICTLSNGTKVNVRPFSSGQVATLEVVTPGHPALKVRY